MVTSLHERSLMHLVLSNVGMMGKRKKTKKLMYLSQRILLCNDRRVSKNVKKGVGIE